MIDHLRNLASLEPENYRIAYFYFSFTDKDQHKPICVLASLARQLANRITHLPSKIKDLYEKMEPRGERPTPADLYTALISMMSFGQIFLVFDALDECSQEQRKKLLPLIRKMGEDGINIFLTSRHHPEDVQYFLRNSPKVDLYARSEDLKLYIQQKIEDNPRAKLLITRGKCKEKIISELTDCAGGM